MEFAEVMKIFDAVGPALHTSEHVLGVFTVVNYHSPSNHDRLVLTNERLGLYKVGIFRYPNKFTASIPIQEIEDFEFVSPEDSGPSALACKTKDSRLDLGVVHVRDRAELIQGLRLTHPNSQIAADEQAQPAKPELERVFQLYEAQPITTDSSGTPRFSGKLIDDMTSKSWSTPKILLGAMGGLTGMRAICLTEDSVVVTGKKRVSDGQEFTVSDTSIEVGGGETIREWRLGSEKLNRAFPQSEFHRLFHRVEGRPLIESAFQVLPAEWANDPDSLPLAYWDGLTVYRDRIIDQTGTHLPFSSKVRASIETSGSIAAVRGRDLGQKAASMLVLGPIGPFVAGNARTEIIDKRKLFLIIESDSWITSREVDPDNESELREFASALTQTASLYGGEMEKGRERTIEDSGESISVSAELRELSKLNAEGALDEDEFRQAKARILGG